MANNRVIGYQNKLPWHLPADMRHFKNKTWASPVIVGRNTFLSILESNKGPLLGRSHIVISNTMKNDDSHGPCVNIHSSLEKGIAYIQDKLLLKTAFVIGGSLLYESAMPWVDAIYLTRIYGDMQGDAQFLYSIEKNEWKMLSEQRFDASKSNPYPYSFYHYERRQEKCS